MALARCWKCERKNEAWRHHCKKCGIDLFVEEGYEGNIFPSWNDDIEYSSINLEWIDDAEDCPTLGARFSGVEWLSAILHHPRPSCPLPPRDLFDPRTYSSHSGPFYTGHSTGQNAPEVSTEPFRKHGQASARGAIAFPPANLGCQFVSNNEGSFGFLRRFRFGQLSNPSDRKILTPRRTGLIRTSCKYEYFLVKVHDKRFQLVRKERRRLLARASPMMP
eukprot:g61511.t1